MTPARSPLCRYCGHPLAWHGEDGVCRPQVMTDASQAFGVLREGTCTYACHLAVDEAPELGQALEDWRALGEEIEKLTTPTTEVRP